jgi:hypothetical protein
MRKILPFIAALVILAIVPTEASAWYCRATSATGSWGWGRAFFRGVAAGKALANYSVNTPRGFICYLRYCAPYG